MNSKIDAMKTEIVFLSMTKEEFQNLIVDAVSTCLKELPAPQQSETGVTVMDIDAFCEYTGLSKQTVYRKTRSGEVPHSKRGKRLYFDKSEVDEWLLANKISEHVVAARVESYFDKKRAKR